MSRGENQEVISELFDRLHAEFGAFAPDIIKMLINVLGGTRLTFPDFDYLYRQERNRRIRNEFTGGNHEELAIRYRVSRKHVRRILVREAKDYC